MDCIELVELVTDYLEGRLPDAERARFEDHLAECEDCRVYVAQIRATIGVAGALRADDLSPAATDALLAGFRDWKRARPG